MQPYKSHYNLSDPCKKVTNVANTFWDFIYVNNKAFTVILLPYMSAWFWLNVNTEVETKICC